MKSKLSTVELLKFLLSGEVIKELTSRTLLPIQAHSGTGIEIYNICDCYGGCQGGCDGACFGCPGSCTGDNR